MNLVTNEFYYNVIMIHTSLIQISSISMKLLFNFDAIAIPVKCYIVGFVHIIYVPRIECRLRRHNSISN